MGDLSAIMIRGLIIVKAAHVEEARTLAQQPPFSTTPENAASFLVPANAEYGEDGFTINTPATLYWASGEFEPAFWDAIEQAADALDWGGAWPYDRDTQPGFPLTKLAELEGQTLFAAPKR